MVVGLVDIQDIKSFFAKVVGEIRKIMDVVSNRTGFREFQDMVQVKLIRGLHILF
jgi:hypothetical protein